YGAPARSLPMELMSFVERRAHETQQPRQDAQAPALRPAAVYQAWCGGDTFKRDYSTQMRLLRQAAYRRNVDVRVLGAELTVLSWGQDEVTFLQGMCSRTRLVARRASNDKAWTKALLTQAGVRTPQGGSFASDQKEQ